TELVLIEVAHRVGDEVGRLVSPQAQPRHGAGELRLHRVHHRSAPVDRGGGGDMGDGRPGAGGERARAAEAGGRASEDRRVWFHAKSSISSFRACSGGVRSSRGWRKNASTSATRSSASSVSGSAPSR